MKNNRLIRLVSTSCDLQQHNVDLRKGCHEKTQETKKTRCPLIAQFLVHLDAEQWEGRGKHTAEEGVGRQRGCGVEWVLEDLVSNVIVKMSMDVRIRPRM